MRSLTFFAHQYECEMECKNFGPFFSGISSEACDAQGGTWCPAAVDCSALQSCIATEESWASENEYFAYLQYLEESPAIEDPSDSIQCGKTREYFGFDEYFVNDGQICDDIEQLRYTRDFAFMDEFFSQGTGDDSTGDQEPPVVPALDLTAPVTSKSSF